ncbi:hypothetical protein FSDG_01284 [Fusobacterium animalis 7_1]|uniref:Uncharacterized protein n=1 Tax=Fusobacterium animalis 7_1 TaxID=457405 RepID=A0A140PS58_9FUSO|nr:MULTISPECIES: hypothetical protein [Fusobacterium]EEO42725.2 hypothetical protein FSDG_01284 [Fusobacterium animalis 7_1]EPC07749.1 hypothetical protein HMPREF9369_02559 [Fusobacterium polymorphum F0401]ERT41342.1 hypothetical protein HMPREF1538_00954 [Fusobacterium nucleatum CTI-1]
MSYFEGLKLTKKGEQLQAKINGNLSETLTFTKAKLGSGSITSNDEIRFLTDVKEEWGIANVASCKIQGDEKNIVSIELQFSNAGLRENKIFREIGLYAKGNEEEEILYAYANAGDKYDYIPLMKDSPHSFVIVIYFNITSGTKVDANIDLHSYITLQEFNEGMNKKVNKTDYASAEQYGIVKYGTQENTALEGNKIEEITGKTYGGVLNEIGLKEAGKTYFDKNTKKLYLCKNNNTDISANINNYIAMDSHSILERLENLFKYSEIFKGRASAKGQVLGSIPDNSKFLEIIGINYASDGNFYYFTPIILRTEIVRNNDVAITIGLTSDTREFILSFKNNVITITYSATLNSTADNNFISQILSING